MKKTPQQNPTAPLPEVSEPTWLVELKRCIESESYFIALCNIAKALRRQPEQHGILFQLALQMINNNIKNEPIYMGLPIIYDALKCFPQQCSSLFQLALQTLKNNTKPACPFIMQGVIYKATKAFPQQRNVLFKLALQQLDKAMKNYRGDCRDYRLRGAVQEIRTTFPEQTKGAPHKSPKIFMDHYKKPSETEVRKNTRTLFIERKKPNTSSYFSSLGNDLLLTIAALTATYGAHSDQDALAIAHDEHTNIKNSQAGTEEASTENTGGASKPTQVTSTASNLLVTTQYPAKTDDDSAEAGQAL
jgi:hypothetical protein